MHGQSIIAGVVLGILTIGAGSALADVNPSNIRNSADHGSNTMQPSDHPGHGGNSGYLPWIGGGFGGIYAANAYSGPRQQQQQAQIYDIAPAVGQAAFAEGEFDNRWAGLMVMVDRARQEFKISEEYQTATRDMQAAQHEYESAVDVVLSRLQNDKEYKDLVEKRTQQQVALSSTGIDTGLRNAVATQKLHYGSMATQLEAVALSNDATVQGARAKLVAADEKLRLTEKKFELDLYHRPEVAAARGQMETARANKAGAEGYLYGASITRSDQLNLNDQNNTGNTVYLGGWGPYSRGYYGIGAF
jgi:hypothetical protein